MGVEIQKQQIQQQLAEQMQNIMEFKRLLRSQKELQYYSGKVQILTDLLQKLLALYSGHKSKVTTANCAKIYQNTQNTQ